MKKAQQIKEILNRWNPKDVYEWILGLPANLSLYSDTFVHNGVDGSILLNCVTKYYLKDIIGMKHENDIQQLFDNVQYLRFLIYDNKYSNLQKLYLNAGVSAKNIQQYVHKFIRDANKDNDFGKELISLLYNELRTLNRTFDDIVHWLAKLEFFTLSTPGADDMQSIKITTCFLCIDLINITGKIFKLYMKTIKESSSPKSPDGKFILNDYLGTLTFEPARKTIQQSSNYTLECKQNQSDIFKRRISYNPDLFDEVISMMDVIIEFNAMVVQSASRFDPSIFFDAFYYRKVILRNPGSQRGALKYNEPTAPNSATAVSFSSNARKKSHRSSSPELKLKLGGKMKHLDVGDQVKTQEISNIWGLQIDIVNNLHTISNIIPQSPASNCQKLNVGDQIIAVGKQIIIGWELRKVHILLSDCNEATLPLLIRTNGNPTPTSRHPSINYGGYGNTATDTKTTNAGRNSRHSSNDVKSSVKISPDTSLLTDDKTGAEPLKNTTSESTLSPDENHTAKSNTQYVDFNGLWGDRKDSTRSSHKYDSGINVDTTMLDDGRRDSLSSNNTRFKFSPLQFVYSTPNNQTTPEIKRTLNVVQNILNQQDLGLLKPNIVRAIIPTPSAGGKDNQLLAQIHYASSFSSSEDTDESQRDRRHKGQSDAMPSFKSFKRNPSPLIDKKQQQQQKHHQQMAGNVNESVKDTTKGNVDKSTKYVTKDQRTDFSTKPLTDNAKSKTDSKGTPTPIRPNHLGKFVRNLSRDVFFKPLQKLYFGKTFGKKGRSKENSKELSTPALKDIKSPDELADSGTHVQFKIDPLISLVENNTDMQNVESSNGMQQSGAAHAIPILSIEPNDIQQCNGITNQRRQTFLPIQDHPSSTYNHKLRRKTAGPDFLDYYVPFRQFETTNLNKPTNHNEAAMRRDPIGAVVNGQINGHNPKLNASIQPIKQKHLEEEKTVSDVIPDSEDVKTLNNRKPKERALSEALDLADKLANPELEKKRNSLEKAIQRENKDFPQIQTWILVKKIQTSAPSSTTICPSHHKSSVNSMSPSNFNSPSNFQKVLSSTLMSLFPSSLKSNWYQTKSLLYYLDQGDHTDTSTNDIKDIKRPAPYMYLQTPSWNTMANEMKFDIESIHLPDYMVKPSLRMHNSIKLIGDNQIIYMAFSNHSDFKKWLEKLKAISKGYYQLNNSPSTLNKKKIGQLKNIFANESAASLLSQ